MFFDYTTFDFIEPIFAIFHAGNAVENWATLPSAEAFNRPRRRFFQPEDDPFDFPLGNKDPMYILKTVVVRKGF